MNHYANAITAVVFLIVAGTLFGVFLTSGGWPLLVIALLLLIVGGIIVMALADEAVEARQIRHGLEDEIQQEWAELKRRETMTRLKDPRAY